MPQSTHGRLQGLAVILSFVLLFTCSHGFFPTPWKEKTFGSSGVSHIELTEQAFHTLAIRYFPNAKSLTKSMLRARNIITAANADVDRDQGNGFKHCDGESFDAAQARLSDLQGQVIDFLVKNKPDDARKALGSALHTVQDFYSHSNWVEMGSETINSVLGRGGSLVYAGPLDRTCLDCSSHNLTDTNDAYCFDCRDNEYGMTSMLTSGYYLDETESSPGIPEFKCHHGGYTGDAYGAAISLLKSELIVDRLGGINKDSLNCGWSPHAYAHRDAVSLAIGATIQYIDDIQQKITNSQLRLLFGVGQTLAFVIDTTGSMGDILSSVESSSISLVSDRLGTLDEPSSYVVSPFNDPDTGTVTKTTDFNVFKETMKSVTASGGGDCPELSMTGIFNAVTVLEKGSTVFMFTDAAPKDAGIAGDVIAMAVAKDIQIEIFKFDSDCDDGLIAKRLDSVCDEVYSAVAYETGGEYHSLPRSEVASLRGIIDSLTRMDSNFILRVAGTGESTVKTYTVPVDSSMTQVTFSLHGMEASVSLVQPTGDPLNLTFKNVRNIVLSDGTFVTVVNPAPGYWRVQISATGSFSLNVYGVSPLQLASFNFAALAGRPGHTGYFSLEGSPPYNADIAAIGLMSGPFLTTAFDFRDAKDLVLQILSMEAGSGAFGDPPANSFFTLLRLSAGEKYLYVSGLDIAGQPYQRVLPSTIMPIYSNLTYLIDNGTSLDSNFTGPMISTSSISSTAMAAYTSITSIEKFPKYYANTSTCSSFSSTDSSKPTGSVHNANGSTYLGLTTAANCSNKVTNSVYFTTSTYVASSANTHSSLYYSNSSMYSKISLAMNLSSLSIFPVPTDGSKYSIVTFSLNTTYLTTYTSLDILTGTITRSQSSMAFISSASTEAFPYGNGTNTMGSLISTAASTSFKYFANSTTVASGPHLISGAPTMSENISALNASALDSSTVSSKYSTGQHSLQGYTISEIVYTTISVCSTTISKSISGMPTNVVNSVVSTIVLTSTFVIPCHKCSNPSEIVTLPPSARISTLYEHTAPDFTAAMTITEIIYITTLLYPVTVGASIVSGLTSYSITTSVSTLTLTVTSTVPCHKCGPPYATVTLLLVEISGSRQQTYGSVSTSVSPYLVAALPPPRTYGAMSSSVSGFSYTSNKNSGISAGPAHIDTISLAHVFQSYSSIRASASESGSISSSHSSGVETAPANMVIVSLVRPPQTYVTALLSTYESSSITTTANGITRIGPSKPFYILPSALSETYGAAPTGVVESVSKENAKSTINSPVLGVIISAGLTADEQGGSGARLPKSSALPVPSYYGSEESGAMSSGRANSVAIALLSISTPATASSYGPGEGTAPNVVPNNTSQYANPHYTYHGPLYTGNADKSLMIFGGSSAVGFLVVIICGIFVV